MDDSRFSSLDWGHYLWIVFYIDLSNINLIHNNIVEQNKNRRTMKIISKNVFIDVLIYTALYIVSAISMFLVEFLGAKGDLIFLLKFRIISMLIDMFLWSIFDKLRAFLVKSWKWSSYWSNVISFALIIDTMYVLRLKLYQDHFGNLDIYIPLVFASTLVIGPITVWSKEKIKTYISNRKIK